MFLTELVQLMHLEDKLLRVVQIINDWLHAQTGGRFDLNYMQRKVFTDLPPFNTRTCIISILGFMVVWAVVIWVLHNIIMKPILTRFKF